MDHILILSDKDEIQADEKRSSQFAQMAYTLKEYAADIVTLPSAATIFETFCKVSSACITPAPNTTNLLQTTF